MRKFLIIASLVAILWSCSSYVRFTSDDLDDIKTFGNLVYDGSKKIIEQLEEELNNENKGNKFEGRLLT